MQAINLNTAGDAAWPELDPEAGKMNLVELPWENMDVAFLDEGTEDGQPVVLIRSDWEGTAYVMQLTGRQFQAIASMFNTKYGEVQ